MARRRRGDLAPAEVSAPAPGSPQDEPRLRVHMEGTAEQVKHQLGVSVPGKEEVKVDKRDDRAEKDLFVQALRNPKYQLRIKRISPRTFGEHKTNVELFGSTGLELPLSYTEIQQMTEQEGGGGKYRAAIVDTTSNEVVAADTFELPGDPIVPADVMSEADRKTLFLEGEPKSLADMTEESLDRQAKATAKMIEVETLQNQLKELRSRSNSSAASPVRDARIDELERRLADMRRQDEIAAIERRHQEEMRQLREMVAKSQQPQGQSEIALILKQMQNMQQQADQRFGDLLKAMQDDKMNAMMRELQAIKNKPASDGGGMIEAFKMFRSVAEMMGVDLPGQKDDDEDDSDKPWYEKMADRYLPKLMDMFEEKSKKGENVSREEFMARVAEAAKAAEDEAVANAQRRLNLAAAPPLKLIPPAPAQVIPPPPPVVDMSKVIPPAPVVPPPAAPLAAPPPPVAPAGGTLTLQQEILLRVNGVLEILFRESELRPNEYLWNYEGCWQSLPESILEKVAMAQDLSTMIDAMAIEGIDPEKFAAVKAQILANPKAVAYLDSGRRELAGWWAKKLVDPQFDPYASDDDGEEGEVE